MKKVNSWRQEKFFVLIERKLPLLLALISMWTQAEKRVVWTDIVTTKVTEPCRHFVQSSERKNFECIVLICPQEKKDDKHIWGISVAIAGLKNWIHLSARVPDTLKEDTFLRFLYSMFKRREKLASTAVEEVVLCLMKSNHSEKVVLPL